MAGLGYVLCIVGALFLMAALTLCRPTVLTEFPETDLEKRPVDKPKGDGIIGGISFSTICYGMSAICLLIGAFLIVHSSSK